MLLTVLLLLSAAEIQASVPADSLPFADRYTCLRMRPREVGDRLAVADVLLARDPDDVLGSWLRGATVAAIQIPRFERLPVDSAGVERIRAELSASHRRPGLHLTAGATGKGWGGPGEARKQILEAIDLYRQAGREDDAFHALYLLTRIRSSGDEGSADDLRSFRALAEARGDALSRSMALQLAARDVYRRDFEAALLLRQEALPILRTLPPGALLVDCLNGIGNCLRRRGDFDEASPYHEEALEISRSQGLVEQELAAVEGLALIAKNRREWDKALGLFERNMQLATESGDVGSYVTTLSNARQIHRAQGNYLEGRRMAERALALVREHDLDGFRTSTLDAMASEELLIGRLERGRDLLEEAVRAAEEIGRPSDLVFPLIHLANVHEDMGDVDGAMKYVERGLEVARATGHKRGEAHLRAQRADLFYELERYEESLEAVRPLLQSVEAGDPGLSWSCTRTAAAALARLDRVDEAIAVLDSCDARYGDASVHAIERIRNVSMKGDLLASAGRLAQGVPLLESALESFVSLDDPLNQMTANSRLGDAYLEMGRESDALPLFEKCVAWTEELQSGLTVGEDRASVLSVSYDDHVGLATAFARVGRVADAFGALEQSRAGEMRRLYSSAAPGLPERIRPELAADIERVEAHLATLQATVLEERAKPAGSRSAEFPDLVARTDSLKGARDDLVRTVQREAPHYSRELGLVAPVSAADVMRALSPGETFLAAMVGQKRTLVFRGTTSAWSCREIAWGESELRLRVNELIDAVRAGESNWRARAAAIADSLLGTEPWSGERCIVSPDGPLHCLPFEILDVRSAESGERHLLVERAEVIVTPSATLYLARPTPGAETRDEGPLTLVAFGDPALPGDPPDQRRLRFAAPPISSCARFRSRAARSSDSERDSREAESTSATKRPSAGSSTRRRMRPCCTSRLTRSSTIASPPTPGSCSPRGARIPRRPRTTDSCRPSRSSGTRCLSIS